MGLRGFSGIQSILYHIRQPTSIVKTSLISYEENSFINNRPVHPIHLSTFSHKTSGDPIESRLWLMGNKDVKIGISTPDKEMDYFYRNALCDELFFVHKGKGVLHSQFGRLPFHEGDYVVIPVGTTYYIENTKGKCRFLTVESRGRIEPPKKYRNEYGQFLERSPYCERDIRVPEELTPIDKEGEHEVRVRHGSRYTSITLDHHPLDVVGWDGFLYPWIFNISDFEPITGRVHQPPPVHQTFAADGYVLCSFVPRMYDYHPESIPAPYNHSNVNSDEVLYYVEGEFMSREGIDIGSFTIHPAGIPHGPHPGTIEKSIGEKRTEELAVMIDTFHPLLLTKEALALEDKEYEKSWLE